MVDLVDDGIHDPISFKRRGDFSVRYLPKKIEEEPFILQPDYQRDHVWTDEQMAEFMGFLLEGGRTQNLVWNDRGLPDGYAVVDGQQRLQSILSFMDNEIPARVEDPETGEPWDIYVEDLNDQSMTVLSNSVTVPVGIVELSREEVLKLYIKLNSGGTVHDQDEIDRVRSILQSEDGGND